MEVVHEYARRLEIKNLQSHMFMGEGQNPLIVYVVEPEEAEGSKNVMFYGHLDK